MTTKSEEKFLPPRPPEFSTPVTFKEMLRYCVVHQEHILLHYPMRGEQNVQLSKVPFGPAMRILKFWYENDVIPNLMKVEESRHEFGVNEWPLPPI
jgi:hypothetical protein